MDTLARLDCGHHPPNPDGHLMAGWGRDSSGRTYCYECCGKRDAESMVSGDRMTLYLVGWNPAEVTNWPGTLRFTPTRMRKGRHNIAGTRYDVWFRGPDGARWWGVNYGEWTQVLHCRKLKK